MYCLTSSGSSLWCAGDNGHHHLAGANGEDAAGGHAESDSNISEATKRQNPESVKTLPPSTKRGQYSKPTATARWPGGFGARPVAMPSDAEGTEVGSVTAGAAARVGSGRSRAHHEIGGRRAAIRQW